MRIYIHTSPYFSQGCAHWAVGLEHESLLVHSREENREEYVVNVGTVALHMARFGRVFGLDREAHSVAVYLEKTGTAGQGNWSTSRPIARVSTEAKPAEGNTVGCAFFLF